jgi:hypothetical protein
MNIPISSEYNLFFHIRMNNKFLKGNKVKKKDTTKKHMCVLRLIGILMREI